MADRNPHLAQRNARAERSELLPLGSTATQVVLEFKRLHAEIRRISFVFYPEAPGLEERALSNRSLALRSIFSEADSLAKSTGCDVPLWDFAWFLTDDAESLQQVLAQTLKHDLERQANNTLALDLSSLNRRSIQERIDSLGSNLLLGVCSKCQLLDGSTAHIPMMDFRCQATDENLQKVQTTLRGIGQSKGYVLESGRSYHFYGLDLLDQKSWVRFMANCLLLSPLVDSRYIAHRLIDEMCVLRLSTSQRHPKTPVVVASL